MKRDTRANASAFQDSLSLSSQTVFCSSQPSPLRRFLDMIAEWREAPRCRCARSQTRSQNIACELAASEWSCELRQRRHASRGQDDFEGARRFPANKRRRRAAGKTSRRRRDDVSPLTALSSRSVALHNTFATFSVSCPPLISSPSSAHGCRRSQNELDTRNSIYGNPTTENVANPVKQKSHSLACRNALAVLNESDEPFLTSAPKPKGKA